MKFEWKIKDWRKWLVIGVAAFIGACLNGFIYPLQPNANLSVLECKSIITQIGGIVGSTLWTFVLGGLFAIPFKGKEGAAVGVIVIVAVWGLVFFGQSFH
jgi:hypothetical protein